MLSSAIKRQIPRAIPRQIPRQIPFASVAPRAFATKAVATRTVPKFDEEKAFVNYCFNLFDLNGNGEIELWEINAVYETGAGGVVGAAFVESGCAGDVKNTGMESAEGYKLGINFDSETMKAMDLIRAVQKGKVEVEKNAEGQEIVTKDEFTRWALRVVDLHEAGKLASEGAALEKMKDALNVGKAAPAAAVLDTHADRMVTQKIDSLKLNRTLSSQGES